MGYAQIIKRTACIGWLLIGINAHAQYYYSDLIATRQAETKQKLYQTHRVKKMEEWALLPNGERQTEYRQWTLISPKADTTLQQRLESSGSNLFTTTFDRQGNLSSQTERQPGRLVITRFERNNNGWITRIENLLEDSLMEVSSREVHSWTYDDMGRPLHMWRMVENTDGNTDSTEVRFAVDSSGLVTEERIYKKGKEFDFLYYYYDQSGHITDIVRYNRKWKRLLPDQIFEYDDAGKMIQRMQLTGNREISYLIWRYQYDNKEMMIQETLYNNLKQPTGSIRYVYEYYQP